MQLLGHLKVNDEVILVLARPHIPRAKFGYMKAGYVYLKLRKSGALGQEMTDESLFLAGEPQVLEKLKSGKVVVI